MRSSWTPWLTTVRSTRPSLLAHSLQIHCIGPTGPRSHPPCGIGLKNETLQLYYNDMFLCKHVCLDILKKEKIGCKKVEAKVSWWWWNQSCKRQCVRGYGDYSLFSSFFTLIGSDKRIKQEMEIKRTKPDM